MSRFWGSRGFMLLPAAIVLLLYLSAVRYDFVWGDLID